jgi:hypothetical protein
MGFEIFVPTLSKKDKTAKDYIIEIILEEPNLTIRKIENRIKKKYGYSVTYQAVRKAILQFLKEGVLEKKGKTYNLSKKWIDSLSTLCERLNTKVKCKLPYNIIESKNKEDYQVIYFDSLISRRDYLEEFERKIAPTLKKKMEVMQIPHGYYTALNKAGTKERMRFFNKHKVKIYRAYGGKTFLDRLAASVYRTCGAKTKTGAKFKGDSWIIVLGDYIFQTFPNRHTRKMDKKFFSSSFKFDKSYFKTMRDLYHKKCKVKVIIQKNSDLAEHLREQILGYFN